ncbi:hypothetical protein WNZ14_18235 [Hoeflea sp. AS60]|uniref:hypothetical protein n=1 Tax=Hoeflea sp. AS60 TaxID=3135780 RepID=UPI00317ADFFF
MAVDALSRPVHGPIKPASAHTPGDAPLASHRTDDTALPHLPQQTAPLALDLVELDLALDLSDIADRGFDDAVRDAAKVIGGEFLFDLPASGLVDDAQRIALVCLSRDNGGRFGLVLLSANGDRVRTVEADEATTGLVQFAKAFVAVLEKL